MFLSGRCPCCWAAVTPARYEYDSKDLINTVVKLDMTVVKKLIKKVSVTPIPDVAVWDNDESCVYVTVLYDSLIWQSLLWNVSCL